MYHFMSCVSEFAFVVTTFLQLATCQNIKQQIQVPVIRII